MSLQTNDIGELFAWMKSTYLGRWTLSVDELPVWLRSLRYFDRKDLDKAMARLETIEQFKEYPPNKHEFLEIVRDGAPRLSAPGGDNNAAEISLIYSYCKPASKFNRLGNPHGINLPDSIGLHRMGESTAMYRQRVSTEITFTLYPWLRPKFQV